jgi:hypothetical protein
MIGLRVIEPASIIEQHAKFSTNKSNISNANYVLCQNPHDETLFVAVYATKDVNGNASDILKSFFTIQSKSNIIIKKDPTDKVHGTGSYKNYAKNSSTTGEKTNVLFTKVKFNHLKNIHVIDT